jgi:hypothetical protein
MASKCILRLQLFKMGATQGMGVYVAFMAIYSRLVLILVASIMMSRRARKRALPDQRRRKHPFCVCWLHSNTPSSSTSVSPGVAAVNPETSSGPATTNSPTSSSYVSASHKSETAKSSSSASPSQSVKANSVARDISSGVVAGIMFAVGLTSILVTLVV